MFLFDQFLVNEGKYTYVFITIAFKKFVKILVCYTIYSSSIFSVMWKKIHVKCDKCFGSQTHLAKDTLLSYVYLFNVMYLRLYSRRKMIDGSRSCEIENRVELFKFLNYWMYVILICFLWFVWWLMVTPNF